MSNARNSPGCTPGKRRSRYRFSIAPTGAVVVSHSEANLSGHVSSRQGNGDNCIDICSAVHDSVMDNEQECAHAATLEGQGTRVEAAEQREERDVYRMDAEYDGGEPDVVSNTEIFHNELIDESRSLSKGAGDDVGVFELSVETETERQGPLKIKNWRVLWGILMTSGSHKLTKAQYQSMRIIADTFRRIPFHGNGFWKNHVVSNEELQISNDSIMSLPHFSTLASTYRKEMLKFLTVRASDTNEVVDTSKAGARAKGYSLDGTPNVPVRTVLPSEYARADLATTKVYELMHSASLDAFRTQGGPVNIPGVRMEDCVDIWPIVAAREYFYGPPQRISVDRTVGNGQTLVSPFAEVGDTISLSFIGRTDICQRFANAFAPRVSDNGYTVIQGDIIAIWPVHHASRKGKVGYEPPSNPGMSSRDHDVFKIFQFIEYRSPSDDVTVEVPDLPQEGQYGTEHGEVNGTEERAGKKRRTSPSMQHSMRIRRDALRRREMQIQQAWLNWEKPIIKPGDIVCLLRPCSTSPVQSQARLMFIHRFWTENEERRRHIFWIPSDAVTQDKTPSEDISELRSLCHPLTDDPSDITRDVIGCKLSAVHSGPRGILKYRPISSFGKLDNGERYFIYRFMLFWDGFEVAKGRSASGDGFYLISLNLPLKAKSSSNAVRIITLSPPGVKSVSVFRRIQDDIIHGMTEGFIDYDATGQKCRIFLDLVGFLGDTPALNGSLDTLGHTGAACCHLCTYRKQSTCYLGSRYAAEGANGHLTGTARSFFAHTAVRDCGAQKETCRLLGMKPTLSDSRLPLHALRMAMLVARNRIRKNADGLPILTGHLDPYQSCCVAPDHLLTGHLRDCINLAFRLLPTRQCRSLAENYMLGFLNDCNLKQQNRLFDAESKNLFAMSMTDLYSLSIVAEFSFVQAYRSVNSTPHPIVAQKTIEAISLVGSISRLIAALWRLPSPDRDSKSLLSSLHVLNGARYISRLQNQVYRHLSHVRCLCEMSVEHMRSLEEGSLPPSLRTELTKERAMCMLAKRIIDKPNVHRLVELVNTTLPMVGHISRVGELFLEKAHQTLKRAIRQGNNKDIQLISLTGAILNDWEGRLNSELKGALSGHPLPTLGCFRLFAGREAVATTNAKLSESVTSQVRHVIGPISCIPAVLESRNGGVVSARADHDFMQDVTWLLTGDSETIESEGLPSHRPRARVFAQFQHAQKFHGSVPPQLFANNLKALTKNGTSVLELQIGDVVEFLCYKPKEISFHKPFIIHRRSVGNNATYDEGPALWAVVALFRAAATEHFTGFWAALRLCSRLPVAQASSGFYRFNSSHFLQDTVSFAKVGLYMHPVAVLHDCNSSLCVTSSTGSIVHAPPSILHPGSIFFLRTRANGFPPRQG